MLRYRYDTMFKVFVCYTFIVMLSWRVTGKISSTALTNARSSSSVRRTQSLDVMSLPKTTPFDAKNHHGRMPYYFQNGTGMNALPTVCSRISDNLRIESSRLMSKPFMSCYLITLLSMYNCTLTKAKLCNFIKRAKKIDTMALRHSELRNSVLAIRGGGVGSTISNFNNYIGSSKARSWTVLMLSILLDTVSVTLMKKAQAESSAIKLAISFFVINLR